MFPLPSPVAPNGATTNFYPAVDESQVPHPFNSAHVLKRARGNGGSGSRTSTGSKRNGDAAREAPPHADPHGEAMRHDLVLTNYQHTFPPGTTDHNSMPKNASTTMNPPDVPDGLQRRGTVYTLARPSSPGLAGLAAHMDAAPASTQSLHDAADAVSAPNQTWPTTTQRPTHATAPQSGPPSLPRSDGARIPPASMLSAGSGFSATPSDVTSASRSGVKRKEPADEEYGHTGVGIAGPYNDVRSQLTIKAFEIGVSLLSFGSANAEIACSKSTRRRLP